MKKVVPLILLMSTVFLVVGVTVSIIAVPSSGSFSLNDAHRGKWSIASEKASFPGRSAHTTVVFQNSLYVIGGWSGSKAYNDVWKSDDGINWQCIRKKAPFVARAGHAAVVFKGRIWISGGLYFNSNMDISDLNDIWSSSDGIHWRREKKSAEFSPRAGHSIVIFKDRLLLTGGIAGDNRIWQSKDAVNWSVFNENADFNSRGAHAAVVFDKKLWVIGGIYIDENNDFNSLSDVWSSKDAEEFHKVSAKNSFFAGGGHGTIVYNDKIWVIGGFRKGGSVYTSSDGLNWNQNSFAAIFGERVAHSSTVFKNKIFVIGGYDGAGYKNDVWYYSEDKF